MTAGRRSVLEIAKYKYVSKLNVWLNGLAVQLVACFVNCECQDFVF